MEGTVIIQIRKNTLKGGIFKVINSIKQNKNKNVGET